MAVPITADEFTLLAPNPVQNELHVNWSGNQAGQAILRLYNIKGAELLQHTQEGAIGGNQATLDVKSLPAGLLILEIRQGQQRITKRLVKL